MSTEVDETSERRRDIGMGARNREGILALISKGSTQVRNGKDCAGTVKELVSELRKSGSPACVRLAAELEKGTQGR